MKGVGWVKGGMGVVGKEEVGRGGRVVGWGRGGGGGELQFDRILLVSSSQCIVAWGETTAAATASCENCQA